MRTYHYWNSSGNSKTYPTIKTLRQAIKENFGNITVKKVEHTHYTRKLCSQWTIHYTVPLHNNGLYHGTFYIEIRQAVTLREEKPTLFHSLENLLSIYNSVVTHPYGLSMNNGKYYLEPYFMLPIFLGNDLYSAKEELIEKIAYRQYCLGIEAV